MRMLSLLVILGTAPPGRVADLKALPPNTWVEIKYTTVQPVSGVDEKGRWLPAGWNKLVYDPDGKWVLFYDRWADKKHGGYSIYGNCLFAFDPAAATVAPIKIDNWTKIDRKGGGYRTLALPANEIEPTPCPRHVYHAFDYAPELKAVFLCNGANQSAVRADGKLAGHDLCNGAWRLDLKTRKWTRLDSADGPPNRLDDALAYCPETRSLIYTGAGCQLWVFDLARGRWRKAKQSPPPHGSMGRTVVYDPSQKRMLVAGGGALDAWMKGKAPAFRELYAFDPKAETVKRLADAPTALYASHLAYDSKRGLFITVADFNGRQHPSGMFAYDPKKDTWFAIKAANGIPPHEGWFGWMKLCYASDYDCLIGVIRDRFYAFRYEPAAGRPGL
jgi:hypothetical protein